MPDITLTAADGHQLGAYAAGPANAKRALVVVQEMVARMGAVTGKGLSDLIREEFGFRVTFWLMIALIVTNFGNVMAEFAGVASSLELFGVSRYIVVPIAAAVVWLMVVKGTYESVEKIFLAASMFYVAYIVAGLLAHPDWKAAAVATVRSWAALRAPGFSASTCLPSATRAGERNSRPRRISITPQTRLITVATPFTATPMRGASRAFGACRAS